MDKLDETKIDLNKDNLFRDSSLLSFDDSLKKIIKRLDNEFRNVSLKDINRKIIMRSLKISETDNSLNIEIITSKFLIILLSFVFPAMPCTMIFYNIYEKYHLSIILLFLSILFFGILIFWLFEKKLKFGIYKAVFKDNKLQTFCEYKKNEVDISSISNFFIEEKYYQKRICQIVCSDREEDIPVFIFNEDELYVANYLAYKINKYLLRRLEIKHRIDILLSKTKYDYHKEAEQMRKDKNITFYDDRYKIGDKRRFDFDKETLEILKKAEKKLFDEICQYYSFNEEQIEDIIKLFKKDVNFALSDKNIEKSNENGQELNLLDIKIYTCCLRMNSDCNCYNKDFDSLLYL